MAGIVPDPVAAAAAARLRLPRQLAGRRFALLVPGSSARHPAKRWSARRFGMLAEELRRAGCASVVIGSQAERPLATAIREICRDAVDLVGRTDIATVAALAQRAVLTVGNDTGVTHLAAAAGCPVVVLFSGASDPAWCAPRGRIVRVLTAPDLDDLEIDRVLAAALDVVGECFAGRSRTTCGARFPPKQRQAGSGADVRHRRPDDPDGAAPPTAPLRAMEAALRHRGPDGDGHYRSGDVGMVQTRLAIIDLATGDQPLYEPGGAALVANAEIYNYVELRATLRATPAGRSRPQSDCELPLHLYRRHGLDFAAHLRGMYAHRAARSRAPRRLVLARDPFGIKPLYYAETAHGFAFASEPQCADRQPASSRRSCCGRRATSCCSCNSPPAARRSSPASTACCRARPWSSPGAGSSSAGGARRCPKAARSRMAEDEALARLDAALADSVRMHQRSDVPLRHVPVGRHRFDRGAGDDGAAHRAPGQGVHDRLRRYRRADERPAARAVGRGARRRACRGRRSARPISGGCCPRSRPRWTIPPPITRSCRPTCSPRTAREAGIKVILSGEGGDELFGGYGRYRSVMRPWWARRPAAARRAACSTGSAFCAARSPAGATASPRPRCRGGGRGRTRLQVAQAVDCADWLPNDLLIKLDRCLMAHGVEGRTPFLDPRAGGASPFACPTSSRSAAASANGCCAAGSPSTCRRPSRSPASAASPCRSATGSRGAPRELGPLVARSAGVREICRPDAVENLFAAAGQKRAGLAAWTLLFYALWHRRHIERIALPPDTAAALAE